jgi:hypothetical protein
MSSVGSVAVGVGKWKLDLVMVARTGYGPFRATPEIEDDGFGRITRASKSVRDCGSFKSGPEIIINK